jgi:SRSO17 transposase
MALAREGFATETGLSSWWNTHSHQFFLPRQYCGELGKQDNCQVAVSLSLANYHASLPVAWRLYLPKRVGS